MTPNKPTYMKKPLRPEKPPTFEEKYKDLLPIIKILSERVEGLNNRVLKLEATNDTK